MTSKKVTIGAKPASKVAPAAADAWVENRIPVDESKAPVEPMKRLTIDVPESLHRTIKAQCAMRGSKIADEVRALLLQKYSDTQM